MTVTENMKKIAKLVKNHVTGNGRFLNNIT